MAKTAAEVLPLIMNLAPVEQLKIAMALTPSSAQSDRHLERKCLLNELRRRFFSHFTKTQASRLIANAFLVYLTTAWREDKMSPLLPAQTPPKRLILHRIARLQSGRPLKPRQVFTIISESSYSETVDVHAILPMAIAFDQ